MPNSRAALRLTELARAHGQHALAHDRLMQAYWEEGQNIGDPEVLRALATELELEDAEAAIGGDLTETSLRATGEAHSIGINAIPAFLLDGRLIVLEPNPTRPSSGRSSSSRPPRGPNIAPRRRAVLPNPPRNHRGRRRSAALSSSRSWCACYRVEVCSTSPRQAPTPGRGSRSAP